MVYQSINMEKKINDLDWCISCSWQDRDENICFLFSALIVLFCLFYTFLFYFSPFLILASLPFLFFVDCKGIDDWGTGGSNIHTHTYRANAPKCQMPVNNRHKGLAACFHFPSCHLLFFFISFTEWAETVRWCDVKEK